MSDTQAVNVGKCRCPGAPHEDGDVVWIDTKLSTPAGIAAQAALVEGETWDEKYAGMVMGMMRFSVRGWTLRDDGGPIPVTPSAVDRHLPWLEGGKEVAGAVTDLHQASVLVPFVEAFSRRRNAKPTPTKSSLRNGSTGTSSTSPKPPSPKKPRKG